jgi:hypothetical protein
MATMQNQHQRDAMGWTCKVGKRSGLGPVFLLALLVAQATGCGRIPPLDDAANLAPMDSASPMGRRHDGGPAIADASCGGVVFSAATREPADVLLVLDDKNMVPQDASNGWSFGASSQIVLLHGSFCDQVLSESSDVVQVLFGCGQPLPPVLTE